jgi:hypothetical protein
MPGRISAPVPRPLARDRLGRPLRTESDTEGGRYGRETAQFKRAGLRRFVAGRRVMRAPECSAAR